MCERHVVAFRRFGVLLRHQYDTRHHADPLCDWLCESRRFQQPWPPRCCSEHGNREPDGVEHGVGNILGTHIACVLGTELAASWEELPAGRLAACQCRLFRLGPQLVTIRRSESHCELLFHLLLLLEDKVHATKCRRGSIMRLALPVPAGRLSRIAGSLAYLCSACTAFAP